MEECIEGGFFFFRTAVEILHLKYSCFSRGERGTNAIAAKFIHSFSWVCFGTYVCEMWPHLLKENDQLEAWIL